MQMLAWKLERWAWAIYLVNLIFARTFTCGHVHIELKVHLALKSSATLHANAFQHQKGGGCVLIRAGPEAHLPSSYQCQDGAGNGKHWDSVYTHCSYFKNLDGEEYAVCEETRLDKGFLKWKSRSLWEGWRLERTLALLIPPLMQSCTAVVRCVNEVNGGRYVRHCAVSSVLRVPDSTVVFAGAITQSLWL